MSTLYSTKAVAVVGRSGSVRTSDGVFSTPLALPVSLGGKGDAPNPEQLFAAGYAACFGNAVIHLAGQQGLPVRDADVTVTAAVGLKPNGSEGFSLSVSLQTAIANLDRESANKLVEAAHRICPYSNALRGNVDVELLVVA